MASKTTIQDREAPPHGQLATTDLEGTWVPTDSPVRGIVRAVIETAGSVLRVRIDTAGGTGLVSWGTVSVEAVFAASPEATTGVAFTAKYDLPSMNVDLHANLSKGLLILACMTRFPGRRIGEYARTFFRKLEGTNAPRED
jgi:hypothetical protein